MSEYTALDKVVLFHEQNCTFGACAGHDARAELSALRKRVAELEQEQKQSAFDLQEYKLNIKLMQAHNIKQAAKIAELESAQAVVTPRKCEHCNPLAPE